jgi:hypothetical protein
MSVWEECLRCGRLQSINFRCNCKTTTVNTQEDEAIEIIKSISACNSPKERLELYKRAQRYLNDGK